MIVFLSKTFKIEDTVNVLDDELCQRRFLYILSKMIKKSLKYLEKYFNLDKILTEKISEQDIKNYYKTNHIAYNIIHDKKFIHMGFTENGKKFHKEDLKEPLKLISIYINKETNSILELACGRGSNLNELSKIHKNIHFTGIDLSTKQISYYKNKKIDISIGNYHNLSRFKENSLDIVFIIEALCHSNNKKNVFGEVFRILRKGGKFIIIDGYCNIPFSKMSSEDQKSIILTAKGMCVDGIEYYKDVVSYGEDIGFSLIKERDKSTSVLASMERIKKRINRLSRFGIISKFLFKIMGKKISNNFISGYLMPILIERGIATYKVSVFEKI